MNKLLLLELEDSSDEEDLLFLKKTRKPTHESILNRNSEGAFQIYFNKFLLVDETRFRQYLRLSQRVFFQVLNAIKPDITKKPCNRVPTPISACHKLCLTLR